ncbi:MAG: flagellar M-ring protein FliF C-terminal domain-containing protein, partial [Alphaproteobacteria bacterium]
MKGRLDRGCSSYNTTGIRTCSFGTYGGAFYSCLGFPYLQHLQFNSPKYGASLWRARYSRGGADATTFQNTLPNAASGGGAGKQGNQSDSQKSEETVNYEISKTMKTYVKELGGVKRVSVAVLVDGDYRKDEKGVEKYTPKTPVELSQIEKLVKAAVGFKADRGDAVEIVNMRFSSESQSDLAALGTSFLGLDQKDIVHLIELLILGAVIALVGVFVVRPLVARVMDMSKPALVEGQQEGILGNLDDPGNNSAGVPDGQSTELQPADMDNPFD